MKPLKAIPSLILLSLWAAPFISSADQTHDDRRAVEPPVLQAPVTRGIRGGERQTFRIKLAAGQYGRAEVVPRDIDLRVSLYGPDDKLIVEMDGKNRSLMARGGVVRRRDEQRVPARSEGLRS